MSSRQILVQKAVRKICLDPLFVNRWVQLPSLYEALRSKFKYSKKDLPMITFSKAIGKMDPNIDSLNILHESGFYRAKNGNIRCVFLQHPPSKIPPSFISTTSLLKGDEWKELIEKDTTMLKEFMDKVEKADSLRSRKRKHDEVSISFDVPVKNYRKPHNLRGTLKTTPAH